MEGTTTTKPRRRRRIVLTVLASLLVLIVIALAIAPMVGGAIAPGIIRDSARQSLSGDVSVSSVSLSWFGRQRIGPVTIKDATGQSVGTINIEASRGLLGLAKGAATGSMNLGEIHIKGDLSVTRGKDGVTNVERLLKSSASASAPPAGGSGTSKEPAKLPSGLAAKVIIDGLNITFVDERDGRKVEIKPLTLDASLQGGAASLNLKLPMSAGAASGAISVVAKADGFLSSTGALSPDAATIDAAIEATDLPIAVADLLAGMDNRLVAAVGESLRASIHAKGKLSDGEVTIAAASKGINADLAFKSSGGAITSTKVGSISVATSRMLPLVPDVERSLAAQDAVKFSKLPDVRLSIDSVRVPLPDSGKAIDLRSAGLMIVAETTEVEGVVKLAGDTGGKLYRMEPLKATINATNLSGNVTVSAQTSATLDGKNAGTLKVDASASQLLDGNGAMRAGLPGKIEGGLSLTGFVTAIAQPFVEAAGIDLSTDVGPKLDVVAKATSLEAAKSGLPPTGLTVEVASENVSFNASALYQGSVLSTNEGGIKLKVRSLSSSLARVFESKGVKFASGPGLLVSIDEARIDTAAATDLRALKGRINVDTTAVAGSIEVSGQPKRSFAVDASSTRIDASDLVQGVAIKSMASLALDGQPAGAVSVDLKLANLFDSQGRPRAGLPSVAGQIAFSSLATSAAQSFANAAGLDLPAGIGPKLDIVITAAPAQGPSGAVTDVDVKIKSANLNGTILASADESTVRTRDSGVDVSLKSPGTLAGSALQKSGILISPGGYAKVAVKNASWSLKSDGKSPLDSASASVDLNLGGFSLSPTKGEAVEPVSINQCIVSASLAPAKPPTASLKVSGSHMSSEFFGQGSFDVPGLLAAGQSGSIRITPDTARPLGQLKFERIPTSLIALGGKKPGSLDPVKLLRDAVGQDVTVELRSAAREGAGDARDVTLTVSSAHTNGALNASVDSTQFALSKLDFKTAISPEFASSLFDLIGSNLAKKPALSGPATAGIYAEPLTIPMKGLKPQLAQAGNASIKIGLEGTTYLNNVAFTDQAGKARDVGPIGLQDVLIRAKLPLSSLASGSAAKPAEATMTGIVLGEQNRRIVELTGEARTDLASGAPVGDALASISLTITDAARLDAILDKPGMFTGAIGDSFKLSTTARATMPKSGSEALDRALVELSITSPRVSTTKPLKATAKGELLSLDAPMELEWTLDPKWVNTYALAPAPPQPGKRPNPNPLKLAGPTKITVLLSKLSVALNQTPMKPGLFAADAEIKSAALPLSAGASTAPFKNFALRIIGGHEPSTIGFSLRADDVGGGPGPNGAPAMLFQGGAYFVSDATGKLTTEAAVITMSGDAYGMPSAILDAAARQGGLLSEALGPSITLNVRTEGVNQTKGKLFAKADSPRAHADIKGQIVGGAFVSDGAPEIELKVITPELGKLLVDGLPFIGSFEKRPEDGPAIIKAQGLRVPIDGGTEKLNGDVVVQIGTARFQTSKVFGTLLKLSGQKESGMIGRRLEPLTINIKDGVATYQRWKLPLGQFSVDTRGTVDLVNRKMDVITYIPFGALTDEAAGKLNTGLGGLIAGAVPLLEQATMVPFRTRGSFEDPKTEADLQLMVKEAGSTLLRPDKLIKNGLDDIFKKKDK